MEIPLTIDAYTNDSILFITLCYLATQRLVRAVSLRFLYPFKFLLPNIQKPLTNDFIILIGNIPKWCLLLALGYISHGGSSSTYHPNRRRLHSLSFVYCIYCIILAEILEYYLIQICDTAEKFVNMCVCA
ncbi:hypothetical protein GGS24DRAFT_449567, partial [Hypoxylon argillaceum]